MIPRSKDGKQRVLSLSYGKDSMACLGAIEQLGWPLDRIVTADVWATDTIPADLPPMVEFKDYADKVILERYGIEVKHYCAMWPGGQKKTFENVFYKTFQKGKCAGRIYGFPIRRGNWCNSDLKMQAINSDGLKRMPVDGAKKTACCLRSTHRAQEAAVGSATIKVFSSCGC